MEHVIKKLKDIFEATIENGLNYEGELSKIDFSIFSKAATKDKLYRISGNNVCSLNGKLDGEDVVVIIFSIPINSTETGSKTIAERVMDIVEVLENAFIKLDYLKSNEVPEDKVIYVVAAKKAGEKEWDKKE